MGSADFILMSDATLAEIKNYLDTLKNEYYCALKNSKDTSSLLLAMKELKSILCRTIIDNVPEGKVGHDTMVSLTIERRGEKSSLLLHAVDCCVGNIIPAATDDNILSLNGPLGKPIRGLEPGQSAQCRINGEIVKVSVDEVWSVSNALKQAKSR